MEAVVWLAQAIVERILRYLAAWPGVLSLSAVAVSGYAAIQFERSETVAVGIEKDTSCLMLPRGWNKQAIAYVCKAPLACIFDSGSFWNVVSDRALTKLSAGEASRDAVTDRVSTPMTSISGITGDVKGGYDEVVGIEVSFHTETKEHT